MVSEENTKINFGTLWCKNLIDIKTNQSKWNDCDSDEIKITH